MIKKPELRAYVNREGQLVLPPEVAARFGLKPGAEVDLREDSLELSFKPPLSHLARIYIEPTSLCNLECRTCIRNSWAEPMGRMTDRTFEAITQGIQALTPAPTVFFGGFGEPLSHPRIVEMVATVKALGSRVELITNGTLLGSAMSKGLIEAGLDMLWLSLDGARPESFADVRLGAALPEILNNLETFLSLRDHAPYPAMYRNPFGKPQIGIVFVAMKRNVDDLPRVIQLGRRFSASRFMVTNILPYTEEMCSEVLYHDAVGDLAFQPSPYLTELPKFDMGKIATEPFIRAFYSGTTMKLAGGSLAESTDRCPFIDKRATAVSWEGKVVPCLALLHDHTSFLNGRERFSKSYSLGNVGDRGLLDLWSGPEYTAFRKTVDAFDFSPCSACGGCNLSEDNNEDCFANTFPTCGGCLWAQGIVQCP
jgi:MoaA/NifB/PqqE/SkfB family radical SAM enzyme